MYFVLLLLLTAKVIAAERVTWHDMDDVKPGYEFTVLNGSLSWYQARLECRRISANAADLPRFDKCEEIRFIIEILEVYKKTERKRFYVKRHKRLFEEDGTWCSWCLRLAGEPLRFYSEDCFAFESENVNNNNMIKYKIIY